MNNFKEDLKVLLLIRVFFVKLFHLADQMQVLSLINFALVIKYYLYTN